MAGQVEQVDGRGGDITTFGALWSAQYQYSTTTGMCVHMFRRQAGGFRGAPQTAYRYHSGQSAQGGMGSRCRHQELPIPLHLQHRPGSKLHIMERVCSPQVAIPAGGKCPPSILCSPHLQLGRVEEEEEAERRQREGSQ